MKQGGRRLHRVRYGLGLGLGLPWDLTIAWHSLYLPVLIDSASDGERECETEKEATRKIIHCEIGRKSVSVS